MKLFIQAPMMIVLCVSFAMAQGSQPQTKTLPDSLKRMLDTVRVARRPQFDYKIKIAPTDSTKDYKILQVDPSKRRTAVATRIDTLRTQTVPSTDIYLLNLASAQGALQLGEPVNITHRKGYDNQPSFTPDGESIFYTSIHEDNQADIYRYNIEKKTTTRITATKESEYSPTVMPGGKTFSVVRIEADSAQRLWQFDWDGKNPKLILEKIKPVGYHAWGNNNTLALFVLGNPFTLQIAHTQTGNAEIVADSIGRALQKIPGKEAISFVHKPSEKEWWIKEVDVATGKSTPLIPTLPGSEFHAWMPNGILLMAKGSMVYCWKPGEEKRWKEIGNLQHARIKNITRLAISPNGKQLAIVAEE